MTSLRRIASVAALIAAPVAFAILETAPRVHV